MLNYISILALDSNPIPKMCFCRISINIVLGNILNIIDILLLILKFNNYFSYFLQITDHDPIKHICRICYGQVEVNFRFATACRINNAKYIGNLSNAPPNDVVKTEYNKFMRIPVHALVIISLKFKVLRGRANLTSAKHSKLHRLFIIF